MADSATVSLGLLLMQTGNDDNTWGDLLNAQVIQYVEDALIGSTSISTTGGATTLTQAQCRPRHLNFSGTLTSDATITVPSHGNEWLIFNATTGNFGLLFKTASGNTISVPQGTFREVFTDGATIVRTDAETVGEFFYHAGSTVPAGSFECTGASKLRASFPDLYAVLGTTWGPGNGSTDFVLPDSYSAGKFLRSRSASVAVGTAQSDQNQAHAHSGSTATWTQSTGSTDNPGNHTHSGTTGNDSPDHTHNYSAPGPSSTQGMVPTNNSAGGSAGNIWYGGGISTSATGGVNVNHTHAFTTGGGGGHTHVVTVTGTVAVTVASDGGTEARPTNISGILCVRY